MRTGEMMESPVTAEPQVLEPIPQVRQADPEARGILILEQMEAQNQEVHLRRRRAVLLEMEAALARTRAAARANLLLGKAQRKLLLPRRARL